MDKQAYLYMMSNRKNGTIYTGATCDLVTRVYSHREKVFPGFTEKYNLTRLVYYEVYDDIDSAFSREKQIKGWKRDWKVALIEKINPNWDDLFEFIL